MAAAGQGTLLLERDVDASGGVFLAIEAGLVSGFASFLQRPQSTARRASGARSI
jgi:hypothetical protein